MNLKNIILSKRSETQKDYMLYNIIYMKCPEKASVLRQIEQECSGCHNLELRRDLFRMIEMF